VVVEGEAEVECDAELMQRVLTNLVSNAIKYNPPEGTVRVKVSPEEVRVCDQGPGVEPDMRERIFEKYGQAQRKKYSTGLGLAFCKLVVEKHGGCIGVDSGPDGGSEFWFSL
jgi:signal transduction histidine kinase